MLWLRRYNLLFLKHFVTLARKYHQYRGARLINERWLVANSFADTVSALSIFAVAKPDVLNTVLERLSTSREV